MPKHHGDYQNSNSQKYNKAFWTLMLSILSVPLTASKLCSAFWYSGKWVDWLGASQRSTHCNYIWLAAWDLDLHNLHALCLWMDQLLGEARSEFLVVEACLHHLFLGNWLCSFGFLKERLWGGKHSKRRQFMFKSNTVSPNRNLHLAGITPLTHLAAFDLSTPWARTGCHLCWWFLPTFSIVCVSFSGAFVTYKCSAQFRFARVLHVFWNLSLLTTLLTMPASLVTLVAFWFFKLRCHVLPKILQDSGCKGKGKCKTAGAAPEAEGASSLRPSAKAKGRGKTGVAAKAAAKAKPKAKGVAKASCKQRAKSRAWLTDCLFFFLYLFLEKLPPNKTFGGSCSAGVLVAK